MFGFIGFLAILLLLVIFTVLSIVGNVLRVMFGWGRRDARHRSQTHVHPDPNHHRARQGENGSASFQKNSSESNARKKIFAEDEGEYVDYEEVK